MFKAFIFTTLFSLSGFWSFATEKEKPIFTFIFMTDIHVDKGIAEEGFNAAIKKANELNPDFILTGGDLVADVLNCSQYRADSLYNLYLTMIKKCKVPVYNTMGNHEIFGWSNKSGISPENSEYGEKMFEHRIGKRYYSFNYKNYHFIVLDGIEKPEDKTYFGLVDSLQMKWIENDLSKIEKSTPIIISTHIPFYTVGSQLESGSLAANGVSDVITNAKDVLKLFKDYQLKLVLQGHIHIYEEFQYDGTEFITGGSVCSRWWQGKYHSLEEGFVFVKIFADRIETEYIDYGWDVPEQIK